MNTLLNPTTNAVRMTVHLTNGRHYPFVQADSCMGSQILTQMRPDRLFTGKNFIFHEAHEVSILPTDGVERLDLFSESLPVWSHAEHIVALDEISDVEFRKMEQRDPPRTIRVLGRAVPTLPTEFGAAVELRSGAVVYFRITREQVEVSARERSEITADDTRQFLTHFFTRPVIFGRTLDGGGIFLLNPANIVRYILSPAPPESVAGAWPMMEMRV